MSKEQQGAILRFNEWLPEWTGKYGLDQFTYERYCYWLVEAHPSEVAEIIAGILRAAPKVNAQAL